VDIVAAVMSKFSMPVKHAQDKCVILKRDTEVVLIWRRWLQSFLARKPNFVPLEELHTELVHLGEVGHLIFEPRL
jgi:hypothetical protein